MIRRLATLALLLSSCVATSSDIQNLADRVRGDAAKSEALATGLDELATELDERTDDSTDTLLAIGLGVLGVGGGVAVGRRKRGPRVESERRQPKTTRATTVRSEVRPVPPFDPS